MGLSIVVGIVCFEADHKDLNPHHTTENTDWLS